jgi:hypothetical protein
MPYQPAVLGSARLNNFRLNYLTAAQAAERPARIWFILGGVDISAPTSPTRVIYKSVSIRDVVFETPNTCQITFYGAPPTLGARLEVWVDANDPTLLFGGELQTVDRTYKGRPTTVMHPCTAIDDTARANRKRPLGLWTNTSATTIAQWLVSTYAPGYSSAGVELGLPPISINFDGSEGGMKGCLTALAKIIGGYWYFENRTLYLFITPPGPAPDPIDDSPSRFLHDPQVRHSIDKSQVRTRVYGKGASTQLAATVDATVTIVPVDEATMFNAVGGQAISAVTPDGAASRVLTYTGVQLGGGGGLVGPGAAPSAVPGLVVLNGAGIESGVHRYAYTFVTASGQSLPSPVAAVTVGVVAPPAVAPTPGAVQAGGAVDSGTHYYAVTFVTAIGETTSPPANTPVTVSPAIADPPYGTFSISMSNAGTGPPYPFASNSGPWYWKYAFVTASGETLPSPPLGANTGGGGPFYAQGVLPIGPAGVIARRIYRTTGSNSAGPYALATHIPNNTATLWEDKATALGAAPPTVNTTATYRTVPLTGIAIGPANVTARRIYRYTPGINSYKLVTTIANNTATTFTDTIASGALGADLPTTNTATANQVQLTVAIGGAGVTDRYLYRSAANATPLQLLANFGNNTATTYLDIFSDATLGVAPPASDTSGLTQPSGQVPAGSTSMIVANTGAFADAGGWAIVGNGEQAIRYSAKTATTLTGIPASGVGALVASVSYNSTVTASPAIVGVTGILEAMLKGSPIHVWVQRDDLAAQAYMLALDGTGDGIYEHIVSDDRRSEASLIQVCDAELALYSRPLVSVTYATRDTKTKSGKTVTIALASPAIAETLTIQDVAISEIGIRPTLKPKFTVTASSVRHSFDAILQMLLRKAGA